MATATASPTLPATAAEDFETLMVPSNMGPVAVQVQWARSGGDAAIYLLDGLRAPDFANDWTKTPAPEAFKDDNVTVVMPVGGHGSWYVDWSQPPAADGRPWLWEKFLTEDLPGFLARYGISRQRNAVVGVSMGASAALMLSAYHREQFVCATALSGYLDWHSPGGAGAVQSTIVLAGLDPRRLSSLEGAQWDRMDPYVFAPKLRGLPMYIYAAQGAPTTSESSDNPLAAAGAIAIESLAYSSTLRFKDRLESLGIAAEYDLPLVGTHSWSHWGDALVAARPSILRTLGD
ncbi:alpha/beta hydrolase [Nocardia tengchongensis]|uniref:alpha/beta hydrolase n=1 Tax=Nocardia tengchongensis TaxID=2055889 RepID=UPI00367B1458